MLNDIEEIKQLKARYFRFLDAKDWKSLGDCLADDVVFTYPPQDILVKGKAALLNNFSSRHAITKTAHTGSMPEITILDEQHAEGIWFLNDIVMSMEVANVVNLTQGYGRYYENYIRINGQWKIQDILLERLLLVYPEVQNVK